MKKTMQCMIRMDDITPDMNWDKFNQVREIFEKYGICPLLGIAPDNQDAKLSSQEKREDFWDIMQSLQKKGWAMAQHGTYHKYVTKDSGMLGLKDASEYAGLPYEEQLEKLKAGRQILTENGIDTGIFMAPGHTFDKNTIKALQTLGFHTVTDGLYQKPYYMDGILCIPCRLQEYRNIKGIDTICLHSNMMSEKDIKELEQFCKNHKEHIIPFRPEAMKAYAVKRNWYVAAAEKGMLSLRRMKNNIANSGRLAWYMQYTYDKSSKKKWLKRFVCLPKLLFWRKKED